MKKDVVLVVVLLIGSFTTAASAVLLGGPLYYGSNTQHGNPHGPYTGLMEEALCLYAGACPGPPVPAPAGGPLRYGAAESRIAQLSMVDAVQDTAPMSRMIDDSLGACGLGASASGIVYALDAVEVLGQTGYPAQVAPGGTCNAPGGGLGWGAEPFSWKYVLALIYGGFDRSTCLPGLVGCATPDCNSTARRNLVANLSNILQLPCAAAGPGASPPGCAAVPQAICSGPPQNGALWHAFRPGDASDTAQVFASLLGLSPSPSAVLVNGFGQSPYCNAINWDKQVGNANCAFGGHDQWTGPGGVLDASSACTVAPPGVCGAPGSGNHRRPPPGTWGDNPDPSQTTNSADVFPTTFQDNDPIRRKCLGTGGCNNARAGEEVCNLDGALGLVLPIVDSDFVPNTLPAPHNVQYPTNTCVSQVFGKAPAVFSCAIRGTGPKHSGECPNGDSLIGGGCILPMDVAHNTSQCCASSSTIAVLHARTLGNAYGRAYNLFRLDGSTTFPGYMQYPLPGNGPPINLSPPNAFSDFTGAFDRIHMRETVLGPDEPGCQEVDPLDQIACIVAEDPCSIGVGRANAAGGSGWMGRSPLGGGCGWDVGALQIHGVVPTLASVQALGAPGGYELASKVYFNSLIGFPAAGANELGLAQNLSAAPFINTPPLILDAALGFFPLRNAFCEDFNEVLVCGAGANANSCMGNPIGIPGAIGQTACGNGFLEPFEECDPTVPVSFGAWGCTNTCRCVGQFTGAPACD